MRSAKPSTASQCRASSLAAFMLMRWAALCSASLGMIVYARWRTSPNGVASATVSST